MKITRSGLIFRVILLAHVSCACCAAALPSSKATTLLTCESSLENDLVGRQFPSGTAQEIERRLNKLQFKLLGATDLSNNLFAQSFVACRTEYMAIIDRNSKIRDVIAIPHHSKQFPESIGLCELNGRKTNHEVLAILTNKDGDKEMLKATFARIINVGSAKFEGIPIENLRCSRDNVFTEDGGK